MNSQGLKQFIRRIHDNFYQKLLRSFFLFLCQCTLSAHLLPTEHISSARINSSNYINIKSHINIQSRLLILFKTESILVQLLSMFATSGFSYAFVQAFSKAAHVISHKSCIHLFLLLVHLFLRISRQMRSETELNHVSNTYEK